MNGKTMLSLLAVLAIGLFTVPAYAEIEDDDILQKWKDYVESYKDYMEEYKVWTLQKFSDYKDEIDMLTQLNQNLTSFINDKESELVLVSDQQTRLGKIESGILNNIKIQKQQYTIDDLQEKINYLANKTAHQELEIADYKQNIHESQIEADRELRMYLSYDTDSTPYTDLEQAFYELHKKNNTIEEKLYQCLGYSGQGQGKSYNDLENELILLQFELNQCKEN